VRVEELSSTYDLLAGRYRVAYEEGGGTRPDFRLHDVDEYVGAVEVLTLLQRADWTAEGRRHAQLADSINVRVPLTTHSSMFDIRRWDGTPSVNRIGGLQPPA
jgi:hypothetical protein